MTMQVLPPRMLPKAQWEGEVKIGHTTLQAYVLPDGKRIISQGTFLQALGRSSRPKAGTGVLSTKDDAQLPAFLQAEALQPYISDELRAASTPVSFVTPGGQERIGYDAELFPKVCEVYLRFRDSFTAKHHPVPYLYRHIVEACDLLTRSLAHVGIIALVDEATGYQKVRDHDALEAILGKYMRPGLAKWVKTFPEEFYAEIYRLRKWNWRGMSTNRYSVVAKYTKDLVYDRLAPGLTEALVKSNPKTETPSQYRKAKYFQLLSEDIGNPALSQHIYAVIALMRASSDWDQFKVLLNAALPKRRDLTTEIATLSLAAPGDRDTETRKLA